MTHDSCAEVSRNVSLWLDGRLNAAEKRSLEDHAASCAACAKLLARAREADALARAALPPVEPPAGLVAAIERRVLAEGAGAPAAPPVRRWSGLSFAAGVLVGLGAATPVIARLASRPAADLGPATAPAPTLDTPLQRFTVASDALLTDLVELSGDDPASDLALLREESEVLDITGVVKALRAALPTIDATDPVLARQAERAAAGTEAIAVSLNASPAATGSASTAAMRLFELRDEAERLELTAAVRGLSRGGLPRPRRSAAAVPARAGATPATRYLDGLALYAHGDLDGARTRWETIAHAPGTDPSSAARASYWTARAHVLDGRPERAIEWLKPVVALRPMAFHQTPLGSAIRSSLLEPASPAVRPHMFAATHGVPGHPGHVIYVDRTTADRPKIDIERAHLGQPHVFTTGRRTLLAPGEVPRDLDDVVLHLVPMDAEPRFEKLVSVRADGREVPLTDDGRETLRSLGSIVARRLGTQGRVAVAQNDRGEITVTIRLADARLLTPEDRHFAKTLGEALGETVLTEDGKSRVDQVELRGSAP